MDTTTIVIWLVVGVFAGWLTGEAKKGSGFGLVGNLVLGIVGGVAAGYALPLLEDDISGGPIAAFINALIGASALLFVFHFVKRQMA
jgi:uncharacterized membrane protein YeaQ/YmgE (transglycosylase-associated protein family)